MIKHKHSSKNGLLTFLKYAVFFVMAAPLPVFAERYECPKQVIASSTTLLNAPDSWIVSSHRQKIDVTSAGFSDGPPSEMAILKPFDTIKKRNVEVVEWRFEGDYQKGKWLSCNYEGRLASLAKQVPDSVSVCKVSYIIKKNGDAQVGPIDCQ